MKKLILFILALFFILPVDIFAENLGKLNKDLIDAIKNNNYSKVEKLLVHGADVNSTIDSYTPLILASEWGHIDVVKLLLENGADVNLKTLGNESAVVAAYEKDHIEIMKFLVEHGAQVDDILYRFFMFAIDEKIEMTQFFLEHGATIDAKSFVTATGFRNRNNLELVKVLLASGVDINGKDNNGKTALQSASVRKFGSTLDENLEMVKLLLENGADPNIKDLEGNTALITIAAENWQEDANTVDLLLKYGANPSIKNNEGLTALDVARQNNNSKIIALLESQPVESQPVETQVVENEIVESQPSLIPTDIIQSILESNYNGVEQAIKKGINVNTRTRFGLTPLMLASILGDAEIVNLLLENKADPNTFDEGGYSFMIYKNKGVAITKESLKQYLENEKMDKGIIFSTNSPLRIASGIGEEKIVKLLLRKGALPNARNSSGFVALDSAAGEGNTDIAKLLIDNGADLNNQSDSGYTPLIIASQNGHIDVINLLLDNGAYLNFVARDITALSVAVYSGQTEVVELLLSKGVDKNYLKKNTSKLIETAEMQGYTEIVALLKNPDRAMASKEKVTEGLIAPELKKPGIAFIVPHNKDTMSLDKFTLDGKNDTLIKVLAKGTSPITAIRLENSGGKSGSWRTKDVKTSAMGVIRVENQGKVLNPENASFSIDVSTPQGLDLFVQDTGALADDKTRIRITFFHKDGSRTYALTNRISLEELERRSSAKNEQPKVSIELKPKYSLSSQAISGGINISGVKDTQFNILVETVEASSGRWTCMYEGICEIDNVSFSCTHIDGKMSGSFEGGNLLITSSPDSMMCGMGGTMNGLYIPN